MVDTRLLGVPEEAATPTGVILCSVVDVFNALGHAVILEVSSNGSTVIPTAVGVKFRGIPADGGAIPETIPEVGPSDVEFDASSRVDDKGAGIGEKGGTAEELAEILSAAVAEQLQSHVWESAVAVVICGPAAWLGTLEVAAKGVLRRRDALFSLARLAVLDGGVEGFSRAFPHAREVAETEGLELEGLEFPTCAEPGLYVGGLRSCMHRAALMLTGISVVLDVAGSPGRVHERSPVYTGHVEWLDLEDSPLADLTLAFARSRRLLLECRRSSTPVLVMCRRGVSRSPILVAHFLTLYGFSCPEQVRARVPLHFRRRSGGPVRWSTLAVASDSQGPIPVQVDLTELASEFDDDYTRDTSEGTSHNTKEHTANDNSRTRTGTGDVFLDLDGLMDGIGHKPEVVEDEDEDEDDDTIDKGTDDKELESEDSPSRQHHHHTPLQVHQPYRRKKSSLRNEAAIFVDNTIPETEEDRQDLQALSRRGDQGGTVIQTHGSSGSLTSQPWTRVRPLLGSTDKIASPRASTHSAGSRLTTTATTVSVSRHGESEDSPDVTSSESLFPSAAVSSSASVLPPSTSKAPLATKPPMMLSAPIAAKSVVAPTVDYPRSYSAKSLPIPRRSAPVKETAIRNKVAETVLDYLRTCRVTISPNSGFVRQLMKHPILVHKDSNLWIGHDTSVLQDPVLFSALGLYPTSIIRCPDLLASPTDDARAAIVTMADRVMARRLASPVPASPFPSFSYSPTIPASPASSSIDSASSSTHEHQPPPIVVHSPDNGCSAAAVAALVLARINQLDVDQAIDDILQIAPVQDELHWKPLREIAMLSSSKSPSPTA